MLGRTLSRKDVVVISSDDDMVTEKTPRHSAIRRRLDVSHGKAAPTNRSHPGLDAGDGGLQDLPRQQPVRIIHRETFPLLYSSSDDSSDYEETARFQRIRASKPRNTIASSSGNSSKDDEDSDEETTRLHRLPTSKPHTTNTSRLTAHPTIDLTDNGYQPPLIGTPIYDSEALYKSVLDRVVDIFPDICHNYLRSIFEERTRQLMGELHPTTLDQVSQDIITIVLGKDTYPKVLAKKDHKRKRASSSEDEEKKEETYGAKERRHVSAAELRQCRVMLLAEFVHVPSVFVDQCLTRHKTLYAAYLALDEAMQRSNDLHTLPFRKMKRPRAFASLEATVGELPHLKSELECARKKTARDKAAKKRIKEEAEADAEAERKAFEQGDVLECQCCFTDTPTAKVTHCSSDTAHFFCFECATNAARAQIELQRYKLRCMDGSQCEAEFSRHEKSKFLDEATLALLERLQQQDELRKAGIEGLEECPRCDYAEIYPSVEYNKVFECKNEACGLSTCRLCRSDSHIPKTCEEYKRETGIVEKNLIAEAMTEALIRKCPKCSVSIIKESGCNKMTCTKCGCFFCDVCKKDITKEMYGHFTSNGPCRQMDDHLTRDQERVAAAEKESRAKILAEHGNLNEEDLELRFSEEVRGAPRAEKILPRMDREVLHAAAHIARHGNPRQRRAYLRLYQQEAFAYDQAVQRERDAVRDPAADDEPAHQQNRQQQAVRVARPEQPRTPHLMRSGQGLDVDFAGRRVRRHVEDHQADNIDGPLERWGGLMERPLLRGADGAYIGMEHHIADPFAANFEDHSEQLAQILNREFEALHALGHRTNQVLDRHEPAHRTLFDHNIAGTVPPFNAPPRPPSTIANHRTIFPQHQPPAANDQLGLDHVPPPPNPNLMGDVIDPVFGRPLRPHRANEYGGSNEFHWTPMQFYWGQNRNNGIAANDNRHRNELRTTPQMFNVVAVPDRPAVDLTEGGRMGR
jgi:hypothetical protein